MNERFPNITIVILAAGASKRMGFPKQILEWKGTTLLGHSIETVLKVQVEEVFVVLGSNYALIEREINHYPVTILNNKNWYKGIGTSIAMGVKNCKKDTDAVLIVLADQPFISFEYIKSMVKNFKFNTSQIIATSYKDDVCGVPVLFNKLYFNELAQLEDDYGAKHILKKYKSKVSILNPSIKNLDIDSRENYNTYKNF